MLILMKFITGNGWGSEGKARSSTASVCLAKYARARYWNPSFFPCLYWRVWMLDRKHLDWFVFPFMFLHSKGEKIYDWRFEMVVEWIVSPVLSDTHYSVVIFTSTHPSVIGRVNWGFWFGSFVLAKYELTGQLRAEAATANSTWLLWPAIFCVLCDVHCWWISTWLVCTFKKKKKASVALVLSWYISVRWELKLVNVFSVHGTGIKPQL